MGFSSNRCIAPILQMVYKFTGVGIFLLLMVSCSSTKQVTQQQQPTKSAPPSANGSAAEVPKYLLGAKEVETLLFKRSSALVSLKAEGVMAVKSPAMNQRVTFDGGIYKRDSLLLNLYGPLGITVGKLQSTARFAQFYYALENSLYEGEPSRENFERRVFLPISYDEITLYLRGEIPGGFSGFQNIQSTILPAHELAFVRKTDSTMERVIYSTTEQSLVEYQKRAISGELQISVKYSNFITTDGIRIAQEYMVSMPTRETTVQAQCSAIEANIPIKYTFTPSSSAVRKKF